MSESTYQLILVIMIVAVLRVLGLTRAASVVEALQPLALRAAHEAATKKPEEPAKKDPPEDPPAGAAPPGSLILGATFALLAFGCGAGVDVMRVAQVSAEIIARAEPCLMAQYESQQEACLTLHTEAEQRGCVADVRTMWKPIIDGLVELRTVRCEVEPVKCEVEK